MRRIIAQRLSESKQQVPHYYLTMEMNVDAIMALRKSLGERLPQKTSLNDFVIKAAGVAAGVGSDSASRAPRTDAQDGNLPAFGLAVAAIRPHHARGAA